MRIFFAAVFVLVVLLAVLPVRDVVVPSRWPAPLVDAIVRLDTAPLRRTTLHGAQGLVFSLGTSSLVAAPTTPAPPSTPVPTPTPSTGVARTAPGPNATRVRHAPALAAADAVTFTAVCVAVAAYRLTATMAADAGFVVAALLACVAAARLRRLGAAWGGRFAAAWPTLLAAAGPLPVATPAATPAALPAPAVATADLPAVAATAPLAAPVVSAVPAAPHVPAAPAAVRRERSGQKPPVPVPVAVAAAPAAPAAAGAFGRPVTDVWRRVLRPSTDASWLYNDAQLGIVIRRIVAPADPARGARIHLVGPTIVYGTAAHSGLPCWAPLVARTGPPMGIADRKPAVAMVWGASSDVAATRHYLATERVADFEARHAALKAAVEGARTNRRRQARSLRWQVAAARARAALHLARARDERKARKAAEDKAAKTSADCEARVATAEEAKRKLETRLAELQRRRWPLFPC